MGKHRYLLRKLVSRERSLAIEVGEHIFMEHEVIDGVDPGVAFHLLLRRGPLVPIVRRQRIVWERRVILPRRHPGGSGSGDSACSLGFVAVGRGTGSGGGACSLWGACSSSLWRLRRGILGLLLQVDRQRRDAKNGWALP